MPYGIPVPERASLCPLGPLQYSQYLKHLILLGPAGFNHESLKMKKFKTTWKGFAFQCFWEANLAPQIFVR